MANRIYIGKLPNTITNEEVASLFSPIGKILSMKIIRKISVTANNTYGYIELGTKDEVNKAVQLLNNSVLKEGRIRVVEAHFLDQDREPQQYWKKSLNNQHKGR